jgi:hypothetical protein
MYVNKYLGRRLLYKHNMTFLLISLLLCWFIGSDTVLHNKRRLTFAWCRHLAPHIPAPWGDGRTDKPFACALLEKRSSLHPLFIIGSSVAASAKPTFCSLMVAIHLHRASRCHSVVKRLQETIYPVVVIQGQITRARFRPHSISVASDQRSDACRSRKEHKRMILLLLSLLWSVWYRCCYLSCEEVWVLRASLRFHHFRASHFIVVSSV